MHVCRQLLIVDALVVSGFAIRYLPEKKLTQQMALAFWVFHYAKRISETFFVHRWGLHASEPCLALLPTESLLPIPCIRKGTARNACRSLCMQVQPRDHAGLQPVA